MSVSRIASRYAKSLIDLAKEQNELDKVLEDIQYFNEVAKNRDFALLLKSPIVNVSKKKAVFASLFGDKLSKTTKAFFDIIINKGREPLLADISQEFVNQYKDLNKISTVTLTTAIPLNEASIAEIKSKLLDSNITMDKLDFHIKVDPNIMGGFVIEVGDKLFDDSIKHKLDKLRKEFIDNQYVKSL
jgi:F-type H+-transporting ATPase subunit delta